jgi:hypothetical protein
MVGGLDGGRFSSAMAGQGARASAVEERRNGPWPEVTAPNGVWTADHKGWFRTGDRWRCEPLTVMDAKSRYMLGLEAVGSTAEAEAWPVFEGLFDEYGLPDRNGSPFAGSGIAGLTPLAVRFVKLGIALERIDPGKPQQNGRHERFQLTLLPPQTNRAEQQRAFDTFRREYNEERTHEALGQGERAKDADDAAGTGLFYVCSVRQVRHSGEIKWNGGLVYVSQTLAGEAVAVEETADGVAPNAAIQIGQNGPYVFVTKDDSTVELRLVRTSRVVGNRTVITEGLAVGEDRASMCSSPRRRPPRRRWLRWRSDSHDAAHAVYRAPGHDHVGDRGDRSRRLRRLFLSACRGAAAGRFPDNLGDG